MLCPIKDENSAINAKGSDDIWVLRLIASLVDLSRVLDSLYDIAFKGSNVACLSVASNLASFLVIVVGVWHCSFGYLDIGDLEEVGAAVGGVSSEQKTVHAIVFALWLLDVRKPLDR